MAGTDKSAIKPSPHTSTQNRSLIKELLIGYCLGCANIIPGVSGGTFLLIFKIYERVFLILKNINKPNILTILQSFLRLVFRQNRSETWTSFIVFLREKDFIFLLKLLIGALVAIISLSSLMEYLIIHQFAVTYALFFGLILVSIIIPVRMLKKPGWRLLIAMIIGAFATVYITWAVNPADKVQRKSNLYKELYQDKTITGDAVKSDQFLTYTGKYSLDEYLYASACGAVSISAMVLPGISGSLVLILMGQYFEVVSAISGLKTLNLDNMLFLSCFGIGIVFGGLLFARLVSMVLNRYYDATMAFLTGLMTGSLYALWPFKKKIVLAEQYVKEDGMIQLLENVPIYTNINIAPSMGPELYFSCISFILGCIVMRFFVVKEI